MIQVIMGPDPELPAAERCCFCRTRTKYWYLPKDVACCRKCAKFAYPDAVPDKKTWCKLESYAP